MDDLQMLYIVMRRREGLDVCQRVAAHRGVRARTLGRALNRG